MNSKVTHLANHQKRLHAKQEQLHDLYEFTEYAKNNVRGECAQAICDAATNECEQELLNMVDMLSIPKSVAELNQYQKDRLLEEALKFVRAIGNELIDSHDLKHRG